MMMFVYALKCPDTGDVRYIGKTCDIERRVKWHMNQKTKDHKGFWVAKLKRDKKRPLVQVLASGLTFDQANDLEVFLIAMLRLMGADLVNTTDGGEGCSGFHHSEETIRHLRKINLGNNHGSGVKHNDDFKKELACRNQLRIWTDEQRRKLSIAHSGKTLSKEHRKKIGESVRRYWSIQK
jgi:hypothetical protein